MKSRFTISGVIRNTLVGSVIWLTSQTSAIACIGDFYVVWMEAEAATNIDVRSGLLDDQYGIMSIPDDAFGGDNPNYIYTMLTNAFMHNTKLNIETNDTDCIISFSGENLGTVVDVQGADRF